MKPNLYICHTAYQVLVDLLRAGRCAGKPHTMVLSASVPDTAALAARLDATGVVKTVLVDETRWPGTVTGLFAHRRAARAFEKLCGWKLNRAAFENVYIHNDWSVLGRYLQDCRAGYILCEDTFGSTLGPDQHLVTDQRAAADFAAKQRGKGYLYWGDSPWCVRVESEDAARCTLFSTDRMVTDSKAKLLESLTDDEKAMVRRVFLTQTLPEKADGATLLLPGRFSPPPPAGGAPSQRGPGRLASLCEGGGAERRRERTFPKAPVKGYVQCFTTIEKTYRWQSSFAEI